MGALMKLTFEEAVTELVRSPKFQAWRVPLLSVDELFKMHAMDVRHYSPDELAELWSVSAETIRSIFRDEPGVLKIGKTGTRTKRGYFTLRIPEDVAERVHARLSA
jgi:hypothetical protein